MLRLHFSSKQNPETESGKKSNYSLTTLFLHLYLFFCIPCNLNFKMSQVLSFLKINGLHNSRHLSSCDLPCLPKAG